MNPRTKRIATLTPLLLVLCLSLSAFGCPSAYKAAAQASDTVSSSIEAAISTTTDVYTAKKLSRAEKDGIANALNNLTDLNIEFRRNVRALHARPTVTKADYLKAAQGFVDSGGVLLNAGVFHVKNSDAQTTINIYLQGIHTGLDGLIAAIQSVKSAK